MDTKKLRQKILDLAIRGKLVPQDPNDEPASLLLEHIRAEKDRLIKEGKIKRSKKTATNDDIEAPFEIPESWKWMRLDDLLLLLSGQDFPPQKYNSDSIGIPYIIGASNIENEKLYVNRWTDVPSVISLLNDVLVVCKGAGVGKIAMNNVGEVHIARQIQAVRDETGLLDNRYIKNCIASNIADIISKANGLIPGLKRELLLSLMIPIAPLSEQKRIVNEVERWFTLIDELESNEGDLLKAIDKAKSNILDLAIHGKLVSQDPNDEPAIELLKRINPKFDSCNGEDDVPEGWEVASFKTICDTISSKSYQILQSEIKDSGKYPVISQSANYIEGYSNREECIIKVKNPVLIFGDHTRVLKYVDFDFIVGADGVKIIKTTLTPKYVYYVLLRTIHKMQGKGYARHFSILSNTIIPVPPRDEQLRIVSKIEELFAVLDGIKESLA